PTRCAPRSRRRPALSSALAGRMRWRRRPWTAARRLQRRPLPAAWSWPRSVPGLCCSWAPCWWPRSGTGPTLPGTGRTPRSSARSRRSWSPRGSPLRVWCGSCRRVRPAQGRYLEAMAPPSPASGPDVGATGQFIGVDVGGTKVAVAALEDEQLTEPTIRPTDATSADGLVEEIVAAVDAARSERAQAVGVGVPSIVEFATGRVRSSVNLHLANFDLRGVLEERLGLPVFVDNDATVAAIGEAFDEGGRVLVEKLVMLTVGTGVGGGRVLGGRLGIGIANAINTFDPDEVVIGGGVSVAGDLLLDPARETALRFVLPGVGERTEIRLARHLGGAGFRGAAMLAALELGRG